MHTNVVVIQNICNIYILYSVSISYSNRVDDYLFFIFCSYINKRLHRTNNNVNNECSFSHCISIEMQKRRYTIHIYRMISQSEDVGNPR